MSTFDSTKTLLSDLLAKVVKGKLQLPDFPRGWDWDDEHIQSLLVSIARSFPIGAVMLLETGGEARFQVRAVEGVDLPPNTNPEELILDGQQRLTSLTQVLKLDKPVATRDAKKRELKLHYYYDIEKALLGPQSLEDAIVTVDQRRARAAILVARIDERLEHRFVCVGKIERDGLFPRSGRNAGNAHVSHPGVVVCRW